MTMTVQTFPVDSPLVKALEAKCTKKHTAYYGLFIKLNTWADAQLRTGSVIYKQIDHGITHSIALHRFADKLLHPLLEKDKLNEKELFLMLSSLYLHDIGMQIGWEKHLGIKKSRDNLSFEDKDKLRKNHATVTGSIIRSFPDENSPYKVFIDSLSKGEKAILCYDLNEHLAYICESHKKDKLESRIQEEIPKQFEKHMVKDVKIDLLSAMLQICDVLHMDKSRLIIPLFEETIQKKIRDQFCEIDYEDVDIERNFQNYYIDNVEVKQTGGIESPYVISVDCSYNAKELTPVKEKFKAVYKNRLENKDESCVSVLNRYGIHFSSSYPVNEVSSDSTKELYTDFKKRGVENNNDPKDEDNPGNKPFTETLLDGIMNEDETKGPNDEVLAKIRDRIHELFEDSDLSVLKESLIREWRKSYPGKEPPLPENIIIDYGDDAVYQLTVALRDGLNKTNQRTNILSFKTFWDKTLVILGQVVLLSLNYNLVTDQVGNKEKISGIIKSLPVANALELESLFAAYLDTYPRLADQKDVNRTRMVGENGIDHTPEGGDWVDIDPVVEFMNVLWVRIFRKAPPKPISPYDQDLLREALKTENRENKNIYIVVNDDDHPLRKEAICQKVQEALSIHVLRMNKSDSKRVFVVSTPKMESDLINFFKLKSIPE